jgi:hypothetical protein
LRRKYETNSARQKAWRDRQFSPAARHVLEKLSDNNSIFMLYAHLGVLQSLERRGLVAPRKDVYGVRGHVKGTQWVLTSLGREWLRYLRDIDVSKETEASRDVVPAGVITRFQRPPKPKRKASSEEDGAPLCPITSNKQARKGGSRAHSGDEGTNP